MNDFCSIHERIFMGVATNVLLLSKQDRERFQYEDTIDEFCGIAKF